MSAYRFAAFAGLAAACLAGAASAQDFQPKQKGVLMLNVRATGVLTDADGAIKTAAGADSGLKAKVGDDVMPTIGLKIFGRPCVLSRLRRLNIFVPACARRQKMNFFGR